MCCGPNRCGLNICLIINSDGWCPWPIKKRQDGSQWDDYQTHSLSSFVPTASLGSWGVAFTD